MAGFRQQILRQGGGSVGPGLEVCETSPNARCRPRSRRVAGAWRSAGAGRAGRSRLDQRRNPAGLSCGPDAVTPARFDIPSRPHFYRGTKKMKK